MQKRPLVAITIGDPAGIGPEIVVKALANPGVFRRARPLVIGDRRILERAAIWCHLDLEIQNVEHPHEGSYRPGRIDLLNIEVLEPDSLQMGRVQDSAGKAAYEYIRRAIDLAMAGEVDAIATAPVNKEALRAAKVPFLDHTEMLAGLTASPNPLTMFVVRRLRIFFLTRHVSLLQACREIDCARVLKGLALVDAALKRFGMRRARIAVAALNPHGGDGGLFGDEEITQIAPAVRQAREAGINASGPVPADAVFHLARKGQFDAVLSLYHDQGHIAAKTLDFERTVSVTAGLPFIRSSVDHGTAFDIAGKGVAGAVSMGEAIACAGRYARLLERYSSSART